MDLLLLDLDMVPPDESDEWHDCSTFVSIGAEKKNHSAAVDDAKTAEGKTNSSYSTRKTLEGRMQRLWQTYIFLINSEEKFV